MRDVVDIAACVLERTGYVSTMKLHKLVYYCQAFSLVVWGRPLFDARIEAWANGPVCPELFNKHSDQYVVSLESMGWNPVSLAAEETDCIDRVVEALGDLSGIELSQLACAERPWIDAHKDATNGKRSHNVITHEAIEAYYSSAECTNPLFPQELAAIETMLPNYIESREQFFAGIEQAEKSLAEGGGMDAHELSDRLHEKYAEEEPTVVTEASQFMDEHDEAFQEMASPSDRCNRNLLERFKEGLRIAEERYPNTLRLLEEDD